MSPTGEMWPREMRVTQSPVNRLAQTQELTTEQWLSRWQASGSTLAQSQALYQELYHALYLPLYQELQNAALNGGYRANVIAMLRWFTVANKFGVGHPRVKSLEQHLYFSSADREYNLALERSPNVNRKALQIVCFTGCALSYANGRDGPTATSIKSDFELRK